MAPDSTKADNRQSIFQEPAPGEEVCITGISGAFPNSLSVDEFKHNLFNKIDMIDDDTRRWNHFHPEIPKRSGKVKDIEKFDAGYFDFHHDVANRTDPLQRLLMEKALEAVYDAGLHPSDLENTRTGVYLGLCFTEIPLKHLKAGSFGYHFLRLGIVRAQMANAISYFLKLRGPSRAVDTACSSSLYALNDAVASIKSGLIDNAIVVSANGTMSPVTTLQFSRLGVLSKDGTCRSFDDKGSGYCRSEATCAILLQKAKIARRLYAQVVHVKANCDGFKDLGITFPSYEMQKTLMQEVYEECKIDPSTLTYLEAHGTGTKVGDPVEAAAIADVFCPGRNRPLLIGSVKSNIGHSEASAGTTAIIKCVIAMEAGIIPPNMHYTKAREEITSVVDGRLKVVSEKTPMPDDRGLMAVSSFGFGGANCHVVLKWHDKKKVNNGKPSDDIPRLVCVSGRLPESISAFVEDINDKFDAEHIQLVQEIFRKNIDRHLHRGYTIASKSGMLSCSSKLCLESKPVLFAFGHFGNSWKGLAKKLLELPVFLAAIQRIHKILITIGVNITDIIRNSKTLPTHYVVNHILGTVALQIGIIEILKCLEVQPVAITGYGIGEIACAYFDGALTMEQAILTALEIGNHLKDISKATSTYLVKFAEEKIPKNIPADVEITWSYSEHEAAFTGEPQIVLDFVSGLEKKGAEVIEISSDVVTFHSRNNAKAESALLPKLKKIIPNPKPRSAKWLSRFTETTASPEYFTKALYTQVNAQNAVASIGKKNVLLDISAGSLSELINNALYKPLDVVKFNLKQDKDGLVAFLEAIGSLYEYGLNPQVQNLYPKFQYPVSRGTPMIASQIKWNHTTDWFVGKNHKFSNLNWCEPRLISVSTSDGPWQYISGHCLDGRNLFPATGYMYAVRRVLSNLNGSMELGYPVIFDNVRFHRATTVSEDEVTFMIRIQEGSGLFEVLEGGSIVVAGTIGMGTRTEENVGSLPEGTNLKPLSLKSKDIYKELRLRGYNYTGGFRKIQQCNDDATLAYITWDGNWVTFMDNMLQLKILQLDTNLLYVPTGIKRMIIDRKKHLQYVESFGENPVLPVTCSKYTGILKCGGIEIRGLMASSIARRKYLGEPVLEKYVFVPNEASLPLEVSIRVNLQIGLENLYAVKVKGVELVDEATKEGTQPLSSLIVDGFSDQPLIQANMTIYGDVSEDEANVPVERTKRVTTETDCLLFVGSKILQRPTVLKEAFGVIKEGGFILSREDLSYDPLSSKDAVLSEIDIFTIHVTKDEKLVYFKKSIKQNKPLLIEVPYKDDEFTWLENIQSAMKKNSDVIIFAQNEELNGLLGLFNCIRRETGGLKVRCFIIQGKETPPFDPNHPFYRSQVNKSTAVNIYKNGQWGTYRHLLLEEIEEVESEHCFANLTTKGDLSSLRWIEGYLSSKSILPSEKTLVYVYYASLNFRDIMTASGRINADVITMDRTEQECVQGFEFTGRDANGRRVMGLTVSGALATMVVADTYFLYPIPDNWTMEQAASVPVVYATVLYALLEKGKLKKGDSILIHSGTGGVGQAAINVALAYGCTVYTTVGTLEKRNFIKKLFPQLTDRQIGNSRDLSFETMILNETKGRGVDMVLNSLAEEKLIASVRCLARGGRFLEIGKFDLASNNNLALMLMEKECSFHGVMLDQFFNAHPALKKKIGNMLTEGLKNGVVKPLTTNVFKMDQLEEAFRFMATGKHTGKVMIQIRKEEPQRNAKPAAILTKGIPRYTCNPEKTYIITGGLGGFGLELADWLVLRGARRLVLTSRTGVKTGYQAHKIRIWKSYGTIVKVSTADITTKEGCEQLISESEELGPVHGLFNLAVILKDALLENQTPESFQISFGPKAVSTKYLDEITRRRCPDLRDFVIFSSVSCGRGNAGQTNYGMANSIMERICEKRKEEGYPAVAVEWGAVGDVGLVAEMQEEHVELEIGGTLQQRIGSCLQVMDKFLRQKEAAVVSSMVVAEKKSGSGGANNIVDAAISILGINKKTVSIHATLAEIGMDSMTAVEIKQTLEREFEVFLAPQEIRGLTLARLQEIQDNIETTGELPEASESQQPMADALILSNLGDEATSHLPYIMLPSLVENNSDAPYLFCFAGIEGHATTLKPLAAMLKARVVGIQLGFELPPLNYNGLTKASVAKIEEKVKPTDCLNILSYSWGSMIGLEVVIALEQKGYKCNLIIVDGGPDFLLSLLKSQLKSPSDEFLETTILCLMLIQFCGATDIGTHKEKIANAPTFADKVKVFTEITEGRIPFSAKYMTAAAYVICERLKELRHHVIKEGSIKSPTTLFKPSHSYIGEQLPADYNFGKICKNFKEAVTIEGNHVSILENQKLAEAINEKIGVKN